MRSRLFLAGLTLLVAPAALRAQGGYVIRRPFTPGTYAFTLDTHDTRVYTGEDPKRPGKVVVRNRMDLAVRVGDSDSQGRIRMDFTVRRVLVKVATRGREIAYDSAAPPAVLNRLQHALSGLVGATGWALLDRHARVLSIEGLDAWWDTRARQDPDLRLESESIRTELGDARIKNGLDRIMEKLPAVEVSPKQSWPARLHVDVPLLGTRRYRQSVVFRRVQGKWARLQLGGRVRDDSQTRLRTENPALTAKDLTVAQGAYLDILTDSPQPAYRLALRRETTLTMQARTEATERQPERTYTATLKQDKTETVMILPAAAAAPAATSRPARDGT